MCNSWRRGSENPKYQLKFILIMFDNFNATFYLSIVAIETIGVCFLPAEYINRWIVF